MNNRSNRCTRTRTALVVGLVTVAAVLLPVSPASALVSFEQRALELVNGARAARGVAPVQISAVLADIAGDAPYEGCGYRIQGRSSDMGARNYFSHTILNCANRGVSAVLKDAGVTYSAMAENIGWASALTDPVVAAERLHNDLMASPAHRDNILNPAFTHVGVGLWRTAEGASWSGGGSALRNVFVTTQIFAGRPSTAPAGGGRYHPVTPSRILDTRSGAAPLGPGATMDLQVAGQGGVPSTGVAAVVLNVAVTNPTSSSYLTVFPAASPMPTASNLNYGAAQTVPNLVTVKVGSGGRVSLFNAVGNVDVIADVAGWYDDGTSSTGCRYHPLTPARILDTRYGSGPVGAGSTLGVQVTGQGGVPSTGVSAVVLNVAVTGPTAPSYLTVFPGGAPMPTASNLNFVGGQTVSNLVIAKVGSDGRLSVFNAAGAVHVIADVAGWYDNGTSSTGGRFHPVTPSRILDTRFGSGPAGPGSTTDLPVTGQGGVPASGASAVVLNVTVTGPTAPSYLTAFPTGVTMPTASNLNFVAGQTVPNLVSATLGAGGRLSLFNAAGTTHMIADLAGWFDAG
jgi:uncharacterized protein YkwD